MVHSQNLFWWLKFLIKIFGNHCCRKSHGRWSLVGYSPRGCWDSDRLSDFPFTFHFHALEKEMATHSSVLAWRIPGMGEPGGLPSVGSHRVGHDWSDLAAAAVIESLCVLMQYTQSLVQNPVMLLICLIILCEALRLVHLLSLILLFYI